MRLYGGTNNYNNDNNNQAASPFKNPSIITARNDDLFNVSNYNNDQIYKIN